MLLWNKWIIHCAIIFNAFYWITGCIVLSVGIYEITYSEYHFLREKYNLELFTGSYVACTCGIVILISSPFGWAGILSKSRCMSVVFCIILILNGICLFGCGIWSSKYSENIHSELDEMFDNLVKNYDEKRLMVNEETKFLNYIQYKFDCCGKLSVDDFSDYKPIIACGMKATEKKGCLTKLTGITKSGNFRISIVCICIAVWQFFGIIICSFFTCSNWNHHRYDCDYQQSKNRQRTSTHRQ